jgi:hypothetical protein
MNRPIHLHKRNLPGWIAGSKKDRTPSSLPAYLHPINVLLTFGLLLMLFLTGCRGEPRPVSGAERDEVLAYFGPTVEIILSSIQNQDFKTLSPYFDPTMRTVMGESNFDEMVKTLEARLGSCQTRQVKQVFEQGYMNVVYDLSCAKSQQAILHISLEPEEPHRIGGIFFDAPELR